MSNEQTKQTRPLREAISEVKRELQVRERCYKRWVEDGRLSDVDATDRFDRMSAALQYLENVDQLPELDREQVITAHTKDPMEERAVTAADLPPAKK